MNETEAVALLHGLVGIPSLSHQEAAASHWLAGQMAAFGYDRALVDEAGNAVGEMGPVDAARLVVLLGHIDTVPGNIPVRIEESAHGRVLYGRGSVDAKGPLATATAAVARLGSAWAQAHYVRFVVVGAVEEEAASSKGARFIRDRFDGVHEPLPAACVIGEPSGWSRVTLGYKGRVLVEMEASQPMAHTAGPDAGVATVAVDFWNWLSAYAAAFNQGRDKAFDQLLPSLRTLRTFTDDAMHDHVVASSGIRLPLDFDAVRFAMGAIDWAAQRTNSVSQDYSRLSMSPASTSSASASSASASSASASPASASSASASPASAGSASASPISNLQSLNLSIFQSPNLTLAGPHTTITLRFSSYEPAWRGERSNPLCRSFLAALRAVAPAEKLGFVVKTGTSDMNVVGPAWNCPILAYGPGDSSLDHTPDEHVALDEYWRAVRVLEEAVRVWVSG